MKYPAFGIIGALMITLAIGLGAYGAHGLEDAFSETPRMKRAWGNAVDYQMFHGLALFALGIVRIDQKRARLWIVSGMLMSLGIILFSFSIYAWVFGGSESLITFTPFGGFSFIFAWVLLVIHQSLTLKSRDKTNDS
jgi:uncharacterized membrane protein YgdD (TMEM256/DUF423 family)